MRRLCKGMGTARRKALEFHKAPRYAHTVLPRHRRGQTRILLLRQLCPLCFARRRSFRLGKENGLKTIALKSIKTGCSILLQTVFQLSTFLCKSVYQKNRPAILWITKMPRKRQAKSLGLSAFSIYRKKVPGKTRYLCCLWGTEKMFLCFLWIELNSRNF